MASTNSYTTSLNYHVEYNRYELTYNAILKIKVVTVETLRKS